MRVFVDNLIPALWLIWALYWFVAARDVKKTLRRETAIERAWHVVPLFFCAALFLAPRLLPEMLRRHWLTPNWTAYGVGLALVVAGFGFAVWARLHLGRNWSGTVSLKEGHNLIQDGPYRFVRHPIYTGLLLAILGSAVALGEWRGLLGLAFAALAILLRVGAEDSLMAVTFGDVYQRYRAHTRALIPFIV